MNLESRKEIVGVSLRGAQSIFSVDLLATISSTMKKSNQKKERFMRLMRLMGSKKTNWTRVTPGSVGLSPHAESAFGRLDVSTVVKFVTISLALSCLSLTSVRAQTSGQATQPVLAGQGVKAPQAAREWLTPPAGDVQKGAALYQSRCTACHAIDSNKIGPAHRGVMGRRVGSLPGYTYSTELARSRLRWTPQTLNVWLEDPEELVAGQRMGFQVDDAQERADLIAYLATLK